MTLKQQKKALMIKRVKDGKYLSGEKMTFNELYVYWLKEYADKHLEKTTLEDYITELDNKIFPAIGHLK